MFSEYASRFLAQSQSRLSNFGQPDGEPASRQPADPTSRFSRQPGRSTYQSRLGNPYQPSSSRFGFASRYNTAQDTAPLFHSALNEFQDEDEDDAREATDFRALQRSRRVFISSRMDESSASENDHSHASLGESGEQDSRVYEDRGRRPMGIKSSWNGESSFKDRTTRQKRQEEVKESGNPKTSRHNSDSSDGKMVDIGLESAVLDNDVPEDLLQETPTDLDPPAFQQFRHPKAGPDSRLMRDVIPEEDEPLDEPAADVPSVGSSSEMFENDQFFAWIYLIAMASLFATFVLVWLHTSTPSSKTPLGDTIYTTLHSSFYLLAVDTVVAVVVALVWMALLRSFVRPFVILIVAGSPIVLFAFSLYPFIASFQGSSSRLALQDTVMRWLSLIPAAAAIGMVWLINRSRYQLHKAIELLEFASRILAANPALVALGFGSLVFVVGWTWVWLGMFTRVFLSGYFSKSIAAFVIGAATWWIGAYFFLVYLWTLSVGSGVVRATTAGTVSNWYFHRNRQPPSPSNAVVSEALQHATNSTFGTICAATLLQLAVRLPLLILPARLARVVNLAAFSLIPAPIAILTNPLVLTYAAIHSLPLMESASRLTRMSFLNLDSTTTTLMPGALNRRHPNSNGLVPYGLAKLLLNATKMVMAAALGFAGWVMTARQLEGQRPDGVGFRGSAYAYVVGIVAGAIGFSILGSLESILVGILDAVVVCYGSERKLGSGRLGYCMEAAYLLGDNDEERNDV
ncbi:hypothetical protein JX265_002940 [Neoarthrinium moseri]|uniref:Protein PNS1 n=1 Tax=Neoarthrinium moseri TaxID=1658444 RepID=A0A9P9WSZ2_9PEZI|nr:hypothetical protein JX265_002940 [Neoarthrinium moseri]